MFTGQGGIRWQVQTGGRVRSSPAVTASTVYVGGGDGFLYALDRTSGAVVWKFNAGDPVDASPALANGLVIAATLSGRFFAVDQKSGKLRWSRVTGKALPFNTAPAGGWDLVASSPLVVGQTVVIGGPDGGIYALDAGTGNVRWRYQTGGRVRSSPAYRDGMTVVGSWDGRVYALDFATGKERWVFHTDGDTLNSAKFGFDRRAVQSSPAIVGGAVYVGSRDGGLYAIDAATGARRWRSTHRGSWVVGSPSVANGRAYVGSSDGHFIQAVDTATGKEVWRLNLESNVLASPLLAGDLLLAATFSTSSLRGELLAIEPATGRLRWRLALDEATVSSPSLYDGEIYLGTERGSVVAVHQTNPALARLAVFFDPALARQSTMRGGRLAYEYFRDLGYETLDAKGVAEFFTERIADGAPSAVVFALNVLPASVAPVIADTVLWRRYLESGGKVVWLGPPLGIYRTDSLGQPVGRDSTDTHRLIGISSSSLDFDPLPAVPTPAGKAWGLIQSPRGAYQVDPRAVSIPLILDAGGKTTAWVSTFRPDRPGSGYVQLWGLGVTLDRLPEIRRVAEYGLLTRAASAGR
jgi:outer membrane protein assembly factor BamB